VGFHSGPVHLASLGRLDDATHHLDGFHGKLADCRLVAEHDSVCAVEDGIGYVRNFCARGRWVFDHGVEHLSRRDDWLAHLIAQGDESLLDDGDFLDRHLDTEVSPGDHDAVCYGKDALDILDSLPLLHLDDDRNMCVVCLHERAELANIV